MNYDIVCGAEGGGPDPGLRVSPTSITLFPSLVVPAGILTISNQFVFNNARLQLTFITIDPDLPRAPPGASKLFCSVGAIALS